jgi:hypothetical protein
MEDQLSTDRYRYILEIDAGGKVIGGRYCTQSEEAHPDFVWAPLRAATNPRNRNPNVRLDKVRELLEKSVKGSGGGGGGAGGPEFTGTGADIPDNAPEGIASTVRATGVTGEGGATVSLDITHTWRGDLLVVLQKDGADIKLLHDRAGGSADNLVETYTLGAAEVGTDRNGAYTLKVVDTAAQDVGRLNSWKIAF